MYGAIDIGGTKTLVAVFDKKGWIVEQVKFPTPKDYDEFTAELASTVAKLSTREFQRAVVAAPGLVDRKTGVVKVFGNLPWQNVPIEEAVEKVLKAPTRIENDTKLAALSEGLLLTPEYRKILYVTISTGISAGYVIDGQLDPDFLDIEPGHMLLEHGDKLERWEDFASGRAVYEKYGKKFSEIDDPSVWYVVARNIAVGLVSLIASLTPEVIVIGGGAGAHLDKFKNRLNEQLELYDHPLLTMPEVLPAQRPEEAVVYGCYELAIADEKKHHAKVTR